MARGHRPLDLNWNCTETSERRGDALGDFALQFGFNGS
jgi:hypothetical protein